MVMPVVRIFDGTPKVVFLARAVNEREHSQNVSTLSTMPSRNLSDSTNSFAFKGHLIFMILQKYIATPATLSHRSGYYNYFKYDSVIATHIAAPGIILLSLKSNFELWTGAPFASVVPFPIIK